MGSNALRIFGYTCLCVVAAEVETQVARAKFAADAAADAWERLWDSCCSLAMSVGEGLGVSLDDSLAFRT